MNKKLTRMILSTMVAMLVSGAILLPVTVITVFAAEQTNQEQPAPPAEDAPKDGGNEHSGHHM